jgi:hypothetical protein
MKLWKVSTTIALMSMALINIEAAAQVPTVWAIGDSTASRSDRPLCRRAMRMMGLHRAQQDVCVDQKRHYRPRVP